MAIAGPSQPLHQNLMTVKVALWIGGSLHLVGLLGERHQHLTRALWLERFCCGLLLCNGLWVAEAGRLRICLLGLKNLVLVGGAHLVLFLF